MSLEKFSPSERRLMAIVATMLFLLLNYIGIRFFVNQRSEIAQLAQQKSAQVDALKTLSEQTSLWEQRAKWLKATQPKLDSEAAEGNKLLNMLKDVSSKHGVSLSNQQLASAKNETGAVAIPVQFELRGNWRGFCEFLIDLQAPESFLVIQQARLKVDPADPHVMLGDFTVAKWFAPR